MSSYAKLLYHLENRIYPIDAFRMYRGYDIVQASRLSIIQPVQTVWSSSRMKLDVRMWLKEYIKQTSLSSYSNESMHTRVLYGKASMSVLYPSTKMYVHHTLQGSRSYVHVPPKSEWVMSSMDESMISLHLYEY